MAREHVEFLRAHELPRGSRTAEGLPPGVSAALLSRDGETGAVSYIADVGPVWHRRESGYFTAPVEILVLNGALTVGTETLSRGCYSYLPAGVCHGPMRSDQGAEFFLMFDGSPTFVLAERDAPRAKNNLAIRNLDLLSMPWSESKAHAGRPKEEIPPGLKVKYIRSDPETGAYSLMCYQQPMWRDRKLEVHDTWEELILLEGDYQMGLAGMVTGGTYIFRQGLIPHGPQATRFGSVWFGRGEKEINFDYQEVDWADDMIADYLSNAAVAVKAADTQPWGPWRG